MHYDFVGGARVKVFFFWGGGGDEQWCCKEGGGRGRRPSGKGLAVGTQSVQGASPSII